MSRHNSTVTSTEYQVLKTQCLNLIGDLRAAQAKFDHIEAQMAGFGMNVPRNDEESEMAYLGRIAAEATEQEHDARKLEALLDVDAKLHGKTPHQTQPVSWLGRKLSGIARVVG